MTCVAHPPWHAAAFITVALLVCIMYLPSLANLDEIAREETFVNLVFPQHVGIPTLAAIRLVFGAIMVGDSLYQLMYGYWEQDTEYYTDSRLRPVKILFRGTRYSRSFFKGSLNLSYFTFWVWVMEGLTFIMLGILPIIIDNFDLEIPTWIFRITIVGWEVVAPTSMLVSMVVKYVLWPMALQSGNRENLRLLQSPMSLFEHNLNFMACVVEVALLGGLPIRYTDLSLAPLFGIGYVIFSYLIRNHWADPIHGPQFIYPFLDPTIGWLHTCSLLILFVVLCLFHLAFCWLDHVVTETLGGGLHRHVAAVATLALLACRFRD